MSRPLAVTSVTLSAFVSDNRSEIAARARERVATRSAPRPTDHELGLGIPLFLDQLVEALRTREQGAAMEASAAKHGGDLLRMGFTIAQVVHDYGDVCQVVTELAMEQEAPITTTDFQNLNQVLDDAIAGAVTEYARVREGIRSHDETERLGLLAHELRNKIHAAMLAFGILKEGQLSLAGSTGAVLERSLRGLQDLITRSLAEVRVDAGVHYRTRVDVGGLIEEMEVEASMSANARHLQFTVGPVDKDLTVEADRQLLVAALMNLLANAIKFSRPDGHVWLRTSASADRVTFEVEDRCGGLPGGDTEKIFVPWAQRGTDRSGLGLGLPLARRSIEAIGGELKVTDLPGRGCIFSVNVPRKESQAREAE